MAGPKTYSQAGVGLGDISASEYQSQREQALADLRKDLLQDTQQYELDLIKSRFDYEESLVKAEYAKRIKTAEEEYKIRKKYSDKEFADRLVQIRKEQEVQLEYDKKRQEVWKDTTAILKKDLGNLFSKGGLSTLFSDIKSAFTGERGSYNVDSLISGITTLSKKLDNQIDTIASYQGRLDTRLLGSGKTFEKGLFNQGISGWVTGIAGMSPYVSQASIMSNVNALVERGIAYNVEQRAFLQSISENIATTFNAANSTLLQLIRIQQADSTAYRLGMEGQMTVFLNTMYKNTEYMSDLYQAVTANLYEASSQFSARESIGFEYSVQKWLGSLYSSGVSSSAVQNISSALGMLGSGNISGLSGSAMQNLLVMSASRAGLSYSDLLTGGLSESSTNRLMASMVSYLADIASSGNNVVRSQYANIFGLSLSDLKAISNVASQANLISANRGNYLTSIASLYGLAGTMGTRVSTGQQMSNLWNNLLYSMSAGVASNPVLYATLKASDLLKSTTGGISVPDVMVAGTGVQLNTTVADLMRVGALSGGILSSIANMIGGLGGGLTGTGMITKVLADTELSNLFSRFRGTGMGIVSGLSTSQSSYVGTASGSDIQESAFAMADEQKSQVLGQVQDEDTTDLDDINENVLNIYNLLASVVSNNALVVTLDSNSVWH